MGMLSPGTILTHYRIVELIARGGMGEVYKAVDTNLGRMVAIKIPGESIIGDSKARRRFMHEAHAASRLSHPNICTIFEVGEQDGRPFIVMEYIEGPTLHQMIVSAPLAIDTAMRFAVQIADAVEEAHRCGIIHRDLKPSNIIVNQRGMAVILDFGLAKRLRENESHDEEAPTIMQSLTTGATVVGTVSYMSPEQVRGAALDARSDIFSFGIVFYEMLAGVRPFNGAGQVEIMHSILHGEPKEIGEHRAEVDPDIERIIRKALEKNPDARYANFHEIRHDLMEVVRSHGYDLSGAISVAVTSRVNADPGANGPEVAGTRRRSLWAYVALGITSALALVLLVMWFAQRRRDDGVIDAIESRTLVSWKSGLGDVVATQARFSRDGRLIVYDATQDGNTDLWIKQVAGADPVVVPGTQDAWSDTSPVFSPDAEQIAFVSNRGGQMGIWSVPTLGGTPRLLAALDRGTIDLVAWSRDGATIYFSFNFNLYSLNLASGERRQITSFPSAAILNRKFNLSPDEKQIAYLDIQNGRQDIWTLPVTGEGAARQITNDVARDWNPLWHPDGRRIVYNSTRGGTNHIFIVGLDGRAPRQITFNDADSTLNDISADGTRILYSMTRDEADLWSVQVESGASAQITSDVGVELWPDPSPDGAKIAYQADRMQSIGADLFSGAIFARDLKPGGRSLQLASSGFEPQWSPDGERLAFIKRENEYNTLWVVRGVGGEPVRVAGAGVLFGGFSRLPYNRLHSRDLSWSPDGRSLVFSALRNGRSNIWSATVGSPEETPLTENESSAVIFFSPMWSPSGTALAWLARESAADGSAKWGISVQEGKTTRSVYATDRGLRLLGWSGDGREVLIKTVVGVRDTVATPVAVTLARVDSAGGTARVIVELDAAYLHNIQLSPDGRSIAWVARPDLVDEIYVMSAQGGHPRSVLRSDEPLSFLANLAWSPDSKTIYFSRQNNTRAVTMIDRFR